MTDSEMLSCFTRQPDGSWFCIKPVMLGGNGANSALVPGVRVMPSDIYVGHHLARELDAALARQPH